MIITDRMKKDGAYILDVMLKGIASRPGNTNCLMPEDALETIAGKIIETALLSIEQANKAPTSLLQIIDEACESMELYGMHRESGYQQLKALYNKLAANQSGPTSEPVAHG